MKEKDPYTVGDDLPKVNPWTEDRLGFAPFAERLARVIRTLRVPNGYVIGLHGEWGSGKTTALNFVNEYLKKHNEETTDDSDRICLVDFRPWIIAGHQDLIAGFFKIMAENVGKKPGVVSRIVNRVVRIGKVTADPLLDALARVALVIDPSGGATSKAVTTVAKKSVGGMIDRFLAEPSLQKAYEDLRKALTDTGKRFLVTIDDLDRLHDDEVRSIMQMVKTVGRLPNVIYLLSYDREIVWKMLDGEQSRAGPKYAEKIVQQEVELPRPSKESLLAILDEEIAFLISQIDGEALRWQYIVVDGVRRWIRHPRDVWRLANSPSWPALKGEIDPADLMTMEGLRLFDSQAFNWIRWNRDFLFSEGSFVMARDAVSEATVERLKGSLPEAAREQLLQLLTVLFPRHTEAFQGKNAMRDEAPAVTAARRGVGYAPGYDAYFGLHPSSDAIPKSVIDGIIANMGDADALRRAILPYLERRDRRGQPAIGQLLEELRYRFFGHGRPPPTQQILDVLFEFGEQVLASDWKAEAFALSPRAQLSFLVADLLEGWGQEHAGAHLLEAFRKCDSPAFCAEAFVDRARELGKIPDQSRRSPTVTESDLQQLGAAVLAKIERAVADGTLSNAPFYFSIVRAWSYMGKTADAKAWLAAGMMGDAKFLAKTTMGLVSYSLGTGERSYTLRERPDETLYDLQILKEATDRHANSSELGNDERNRLRSVGEGVDRILQHDAAKAEAATGEEAGRVG